MDANNYLANAVAVTADSAIPASWTNRWGRLHDGRRVRGLHRERVPRRVLVGHATSTRNQSAIGTAVGMVGEGNSRRVRSIAVTV